MVVKKSKNNKTLINEILTKESNNFNIRNVADGYIVEFNESFYRTFPNQCNESYKTVVEDLKKQFKDVRLMESDEKVDILSLTKDLPEDIKKRHRLKKYSNQQKGISKMESEGFQKVSDETLYIILKNDNAERYNLAAVFNDGYAIVFQGDMNEFKSILTKSEVLTEAEYQGRDVELNKPQRGGNKKYFVYVRDPKTKNVKRVTFGDKNMEIKRDDPERRKAFRARHNCADKKDKTKAGYWSCKFWSNKSVSDLLSEMNENDDFNLDQFKINKILHPQIWNESNELRKDIRKKLLEIALNALKQLKLEDLKIKDITLTGSLANYNYSDYSDIDLHIIADLTQKIENPDTAKEFFDLKKNAYNEKYSLKIKNHEVEIYFQDVNEEHSSTGVYSVFKNEWLQKPTNKIVVLDEDKIIEKSSKFIDIIESLEEIKDSEKLITAVDMVMDKLKSCRKAGLESEGEYSTENIVFKILRRNGYIEKLKQYQIDSVNKDLTLENINEDANIGDRIKELKRKGIITVGVIVGLIIANIPPAELIKNGVDKIKVEKAIEYVQDTKAYNALGDILNTDL